MIISCLTHYYIEENRAGGEMMLHALLKSLASAGHDVTAYITDTVRVNNTIDGVKIVYGVRPDAVLDTTHSDVVITQFHNGPFAMDYAKRRQIPLVYVTHNDSWQTSKMVRLLAERDLAVYNTEWISLVNTTSAHEIVVRPPIDRKSFKTKTSREYVTLVNLTPAKGSDIFYELARRMPNVKFLAVRGGYYKAQQVISDQRNVTTIDNTPNMRDDVYAKSRVVLMPSEYESFGMVAAEAIVSGIPVIATPTAGLKENLGDAGIYARRGTGDYDKWYEALSKLLSDPKYYDEMSRKATAQSKVIDSDKELAAFVSAVEGLVK